MSGGVDSSVAALLLREQGWDVTGVFMRTGAHGDGQSRSCCSLQDGQDARAVADRLSIPFYALNFEEEFAGIVDDFVSEYGRGRTPNPCVLCNRDLKFGKLYEYAGAVGADRVATGHYASVVLRAGRLGVRKGRDPGKDQSYVLFPLSQEQLARTVLPLGDLPKATVREIALDAGLTVADKPDSQEVCFVPAEGYRALLEGKGIGTPGPIVTESGEVVGQHRGHEFFTIGQRKGLPARGSAQYVTAIDAATGTVRIGDRSGLLGTGLVASGWVPGLLPTPSADEVIEATVKIRYRHEAVPAKVTGLAGDRVRIDFVEPQSAITPGQVVVAYEDDVVIGGGWIDRAG
jgi:tRNA-specific 2-thiouridylase